MTAPMDSAINQLKSHGLHVSERNQNTLCVAASVVESSLGVSIAKDATFLIDQGGTWRAIFPARGQCTFEVPGALEELTDLVISVYRDYQTNGGHLHEAFMRVVPLHQSFLHGASSPPILAEAKSG